MLALGEFAQTFSGWKDPRSSLQSSRRFSSYYPYLVTSTWIEAVPTNVRKLLNPFGSPRI
jgi:hypothetical protein